MTVVKLPRFAVIGVPKAGTSSLYYYLREHPSLYLPQKELHFFSSTHLEEKVSGPGDRNAIGDVCTDSYKYQEFYSGMRDNQLGGDISPTYFYFPDSLPKLKTVLGPETRIILMLRNPLRRAFSNYLHLVREGREKLSFYEALQVEEDRKAKNWGDFWYYKDHSLYADKLDFLYSLFPKEQIKIILYEELAADTLKVISEVFQFLNVASSFVPSNIDVVYNKSEVYRNRKLIRSLQEPSILKDIIGRLLPEALLDSFKDIKRRIEEKSLRTDIKIDDISLYLLKEYFQDDLRKLQQGYNLNLSYYWQELF